MMGKGAFTLEEKMLAPSRNKIAKAIADALELIADAGGNPECYSWSYSIGNEGDVILLKRISDSPLNDSAKNIIASYLNKELGIKPVISEERIPATVFENSRVVTLKDIQKQLSPFLKEISGYNNVMIEVDIIDPDSIRSKTQKLKLAKTGDGLVSYIKKSLPEAKVKINEKAPKWGIHLKVSKKT